MEEHIVFSQVGVCGGGLRTVGEPASDRKERQQQQQQPTMSCPRTCEAPPREGMRATGGPREGMGLAPEVAAATSPQRASVQASHQYAPSPPLPGICFVSPSSFIHLTRSALAMLFQLVLPLLVMADTESSSDSASSRQSDGYGAPYAPPQQYQVRSGYPQ